MLLAAAGGLITEHLVSPLGAWQPGRRGHVLSKSLGYFGNNKQKLKAFNWRIAGHDPQ